MPPFIAVFELAGVKDDARLFSRQDEVVMQEANQIFFWMVGAGFVSAMALPLVFIIYDLACTIESS